MRNQSSIDMKFKFLKPVEVYQQGGKVADWIITWFGSNDVNFLYKAMITLWHIWKDRCNKVYQNIAPNRSATIGRITHLALSCLGEPLQLRSNNSITPNLTGWTPPIKDFIKINIDASFKIETGNGSTGLIIRDFVGKGIGAKGLFYKEGMAADCPVEQLECKALETAAKWASNLGYSNVIFESDNLNVVKSINEQEIHVHWINHNTICLIRSLFETRVNWFCNKVERLNNKVAHEIAKKARVEESNFEFTSLFPADITGWIEQDYCL